MKKLIFLLLLCFAVNATAQQPEKADKLPTFQSISSKESHNKFHEWFRTAYLDEFKQFKKENKGTYKYKKGDFQDVRITFVIDTLGVSHLVETKPAAISDIQRETLEKTFERMPKWTPAEQNGRKVKIKFSMNIKE